MSEWITNRLPTEEDADSDGNVLVKRKPDDTPEDGGVYAHHSIVVLGQPWWSPHAEDAAGTAPAPAPATRKVVQIAVVPDKRNVEDWLYCLCDDGTMHRRLTGSGSRLNDWSQIRSIPQPEATDA
jgi:hypothetical protein